MTVRLPSQIHTYRQESSAWKGRIDRCQRPKAGAKSNINSGQVEELCVEYWSGETVLYVYVVAAVPDFAFREISAELPCHPKITSISPTYH